ncbi:MAG: hypothetical protein S4CHLAM2_16980 [Chlamydiales bacterium]|nr:hypothetical protein [Chlamydiales bacterium]
MSSEAIPAASSGYRVPSCRTALRSEKLWLAVGVIFAIGGLLGLVYGNLGTFSPMASNGLITGGSLLTLSTSLIFFRALMRSSFGHRLGSIYSPSGYVLVVKSNVEPDASFHLNKFLRLSRWTWHLSVHFMDDDFGCMPGIDAGGLRRDYLNSLFAGLAQKHCQTVEASSLSVPVAPANKHGALKHFRKVGQAMMICRKKNERIGCHFDPSVFWVALALTPAEIATAFDQLDATTKAKLYLALLGEDADSPRGRLLNLSGSAIMENQDLAALKKIASHAGIYVSSDDSIDEVRDAIVGTISDSFEQLNRDHDNKLRGIHALAQGMKKECSDNAWREFQRATREKEAQNRCNVDYVHFSEVLFSDELQGFIRREAVAAALRGYGDKEGWIREWILDEATPIAHVKQFLVYATGSSGCPTSGIGMSTGTSDACVSASTCSNHITLSSSSMSKEDFLALFKATVLGASAGFHCS